MRDFTPLSNNSGRYIAQSRDSRCPRNIELVPNYRLVYRMRFDILLLDLRFWVRVKEWQVRVDGLPTKCPLSIAWVYVPPSRWYVELMTVVHHELRNGASEVYTAHGSISDISALVPPLSPVPSVISMRLQLSPLKPQPFIVVSGLWSIVD